MNNEDKLYLIALGDLASWALDYTKLEKGIMVRKNIIYGYVERLQKIIKQLEESNKQLHQEIKELKKNASLQIALSLSRQKYNNDKAKYRRKYKREHKILTEYQKWLEEEIKQKQNSIQFWENREPREIIKLDKEIPMLKECLDKLQELKED